MSHHSHLPPEVDEAVRSFIRRHKHGLRWGCLVGHNINAGMADPAYIKAITTNATLETLFLNTGSGGLSVSMKKR